jgi:putative membrane protein
MIALLVAWLSTVVGLGITTLILPGIKANSFLSFLIAATVLGLINAFIRPVLWFLTAPLSVLSFGLFALVINALMLMLAASLVRGFEVKGFGSALLGALLMALVGAIGLIATAYFSGAEISWHSYEYQQNVF